MKDIRVCTHLRGDPLTNSWGRARLEMEENYGSWVIHLDPWLGFFGDYVKVAVPRDGLWHISCILLKRATTSRRIVSQNEAAITMDRHIIGSNKTG